MERAINDPLLTFGVLGKVEKPIDWFDWFVKKEKFRMERGLETVKKRMKIYEDLSKCYYKLGKTAVGNRYMDLYFYMEFEVLSEVKTRLKTYDQILNRMNYI